MVHSVFEPLINQHWDDLTSPLHNLSELSRYSGISDILLIFSDNCCLNVTKTRRLKHQNPYARDNFWW